MPFSKRLQEIRQRRLEEMKQKRAEERLQRKQDLRLEAELEDQKEEERRIQALQDYAEMEADLEAARARHVEFLAKLRTQKLAEKKAAALKAERQAQALDLLRQAALEARKIEAKNAERRAQTGPEEAAGKKNAPQIAKNLQANQDQKLSTRIETLRAERRKKRQEEKIAAANQDQQARKRQAANRAGRLAEQQADARQESRSGEIQAANQEERLAAATQEQRAGQNLAANRAVIRAERLAKQKAAGLQQSQADEKRAADQTESRKGHLSGQQAAGRKKGLEDEKAAAGRKDRLAELRTADRLQTQANEKRATALDTRMQENRKADAELEAALQALKQKRQEANQERLEKDAQRRKQAEKGSRAIEERRATARKTRLEGLQQDNQAGEQRRQQLQALRAELRSISGRNPLQDPLADNVLSGELPWLRCTGNRVATILGDAVVLRGVNLLGLESAPPDPEGGFASGAKITPEGIDNILAWGVNVIRLAINRSRVLGGSGSFRAQDYLDDLDWIIQRAAQGGAYTLLSLRRLDESSTFGSQPGLDGQPQLSTLAPQPDFKQFEMWRVLAERYALEPAVLYDLYSAPHPPFPGDSSGIQSSWELWTLWVQMCVADMRRVNPGALCFVSGMDAGSDLSGLPLSGTANLPIPNLVYTAQVYPRGANPIPGLLQLGKTFPVFVTEWGGLPLDTGWGQRIAQVLRGSGTSWTAAHWDAAPFLTRSTLNQILPSSFGLLVKRALAEEGEPLAVSQPADPTTLPALSSF